MSSDISCIVHNMPTMLEIHSYFVADTSYIFDEPKRNLEVDFNMDPIKTRQP